MKTRIVLILLVLLAACGDSGEDGPAQRIDLEQAVKAQDEPLASPDTSEAVWTLSEDGETIAFAEPAGPPLLTLACELREEPVQVAIVRHVPARPGQKALFPVIGNGKVSRFKVDARQTGGEWAWEARLPASDEQLEVFAGPLDLEATLPGGGMLKIAGSTSPGEFITRCRAGEKAPEPETGEDAEASAAPPAR